jgi:hypothetical protein
MMSGMPVALLAASVTRLGAGPYDCFGQIRVELRLPAHKTRCRGAYISAIQTQPNAADQHLDISFTEASIRTGGTGQSAIRARLDA